MEACYTGKKQVLIFAFMCFSYFVVAQNGKKHDGVGSVSEIIIPFSASIQHNFNLFYEIHQYKQKNRIPSFWYKIVFNKACSFQFTLFPLYEEDGYNFYLFKINANQDFCSAFSQEKIESFNAERLYKTYTDRDQSEQFRANLVDIKPVSVKAGDAIYIEVFSSKGNDRGHILDFRTSDNSFVVKVFNDETEDSKDSINTNIKYVPQQFVNEKQALEKLGEVLCATKKKNIFISSIKIKGDDVVVKQVEDYSAITKLHVSANETNKQLNDSIKHNSIESAAIKIKSTADLNSLEAESTSIKYVVNTIASSKSQRNATRLEVDNVLFSLLQEDLKMKIKLLNEQIKTYNTLSRKTKDKTKRLSLKKTLEEVEKQRGEFVIKSIDTKHKLKEINRLLREERKEKKYSEKSIFEKSIEINPPVVHEKKVEDDTSAYQHIIPERLIYKIQIGVYKKPVSANLFKGLTPVFEESFSEGVRYSVGAFANFTDAQLAKEYIKNMGLTDAFVVAYYKGKKISIADAKVVESKK